MSTDAKRPVPDQIKPSFVIFTSKITNGGLTRSGTGCFCRCTHTATVGVKWLTFISMCVYSCVLPTV